MSGDTFKVRDLLPLYESRHASIPGVELIREGDLMLQVAQNLLDQELLENPADLAEQIKLVRVRLCELSQFLLPSSAPLVVDILPNSTRLVKSLTPNAGLSVLQFPSGVHEAKLPYLKELVAALGEQISNIPDNRGLYVRRMPIPTGYYPTRSERGASRWTLDFKEKRVSPELYYLMEGLFVSSGSRLEVRPNMLTIHENFNPHKDLPLRDIIGEVLIENKIKPNPNTKLTDNVIQYSGSPDIMRSLFEDASIAAIGRVGQRAELGEFRARSQEDGYGAPGHVVEFSNKLSISHFGDNWARFRLT